MDLKEYQKLKESLEEAKKKVNRIEGSKGQIMEQLKREFDCSTLKEAKTKLEELTKKRDSLELEYNNELEEFKKKWENKLV